MNRSVLLIGAALVALLLACNLSTPAPDTPTPAPPSPTIETPQPLCTPPLCAPGEVFYCPGACPGGCGTICVTPTGLPAVTPSPSPTATPVEPTPMPVCTPPLCRTDEAYYCPGTCPGGCGTICATRTPGPPTVTSASPTGTRVSGTPTPTILFFRANVPEARPGDTIMLEWASTGAISATLYHLAPSGQFSEWWPVPPNGTMSYTIARERRNHDDFMLFVFVQPENWVQASLTIPLTCPDTWFFSPPPGECPSGPARTGPGAEQHFQHGTMLWLQSDDIIYVLYDDGQIYAWDAYTDTWNEGDPESDPNIVPPPGLYQPLRGFGKVWREQPNVRARLGWATDGEHGYSTAIQSTARSRYNDTYIQAYDGGVWKLLPERSGWQHVP
jgi:hypothetical protein